MSVRRTVAALLAGGLLLTGCGDDPEPRFEPAPDPTPTESTASAEPEAQTPEAFIREWFAANTKMQNSGQTAEFLSLSRDCRACRQLAERVADYYAKGGFVEVEAQRVVEVTPSGRDEYRVVVDASQTRYRESTDGPTNELSGGPNEYVMTVVKNAGTWQMLNYADTPS